MTLPDKALFTIKEAGEHLALSRASVYRLIDEGMLTRVYPRPRCARITRESLSAHLVRAQEGSDAVRQAAELGRANRKEQHAQQAAQQEAQKRGGFLARFGLFGG